MKNKKFPRLIVILLSVGIVAAIIITCAILHTPGIKNLGGNGVDYQLQNSQTSIPSGISVPSQKDLYTIFPQNYHMDLAETAGLGHGSTFNIKYFCIQGLYRKALEEYLMEQLSLQQFDQEIAHSGLGIQPLPEEKRNIYQNCSTMGLSYIYLRNNLYIEVLSASDLSILEDALNTTGGEVTDSVREVVLRTYPDVIKVWFSADEKEDESMVSYEKSGNKKSAPSNALVLEIGAQTVQYDENGAFITSGEEATERLTFLQGVANTMMEQFADKQDVPVTVFVQEN